MPGAVGTFLGALVACSSTPSADERCSAAICGHTYQCIEQTEGGSTVGPASVVTLETNSRGECASASTFGPFDIPPVFQCNGTVTDYVGAILSNWTPTQGGFYVDCSVSGCFRCIETGGGIDAAAGD
jgi:hypothetical protein